MNSFRLLLSKHAVRLARDERGISAVEFAMLLPLMVTLYLGTVEISQAVGIDRKVTLTSRTVADLASQVKTIKDAEMSSLLSASAAVMSCSVTPCDQSQLKVTVSRVDVDASGTAKIVWSDTLGGTKRATGSTVTLPAALNIANTSLIWGEVAYTYKPTIGYVVTGTLNLSDQIFMAPRLSATVARTAN
jgi:Flp pilus assembly protein TadG